LLAVVTLDAERLAESLPGSHVWRQRSLANYFPFFSPTFLCLRFLDLFLVVINFMPAE